MELSPQQEGGVPSGEILRSAGGALYLRFHMAALKKGLEMDELWRQGANDRETKALLGRSIFISDNLKRQRFWRFLAVSPVQSS